MFPESHDYINILKFFYWTASLHFVLLSSEPLNLNTWHILAHIFQSLIAQSSVFHWMSDEEIVFVIPWQCLLSSHWSRSDVKGSPANPTQQDGQWEQHFRASGKRVSVWDIPGSAPQCYSSLLICFPGLNYDACVPWMKLHLQFRAVMTFFGDICLHSHTTDILPVTSCAWDNSTYRQRECCGKNNALLFSLCCQTFWLHLVLKECRWSV